MGSDLEEGAGALRTLCRNGPIPSGATGSRSFLRVSASRNNKLSIGLQDSQPILRETLMYHHVKKLMFTVRVDEPDVRFGNMLLEQFGGANGELAAAMQYSIQGLNCEDPERKDLLMDIGTEELSHLEVVGSLARLHLKP